MWFKGDRFNYSVVCKDLLANRAIMEPTTTKGGGFEQERGLMMQERKSGLKEFTDLEAAGGCLLLQEANLCRFNGDLAAKPLLPSSPNPKSAEPCRQERLVSLDVFRGMTVVAMILVDFGGGAWSAINHSPWDGVTFADFVVPAFLFIVGVSLSLAHKATEDKQRASRKIVLRALKIFAIGLILQGGYIHGVKDLSYGVDLQFLRIMGILQRIAIAFIIVAFFEVFLSNRQMADANESFYGIVKIYRWHWIAVFVLATLYVGLLYGLYVPDWHFEFLGDSGISSTILVKCNVRGSMNPGCNAVGYLDRLIMGTSHLYSKRPPFRRAQECSVNFPLPGPLPVNAPSWCLAPFDPEGLLSSIPAIVTCFMGAHYGHALLHMKGHKRQLYHWTTSGFVMLFVGLLLKAAGMPINKQLYTLSYTFVTGGAVALAFTATFVLVDICKCRSSTALFKFVGAHALMIYALLGSDVLPVLLQGIYWNSPNNNVIQIILTSLGF